MHPGFFLEKAVITVEYAEKKLQRGAACFLRDDGIGLVGRKRGGSRKSERCLAILIHTSKIYLLFLSKNAIVWEVMLSSEQTSYKMILKIKLIYIVFFA